VQLSPTSYALLGLLSLRRWTTYELTQQAQRSLRFLYPRAERHLYAEAKRLAEAGLARSESTFTGRRRGTTYAITPAGRKAIRTQRELAEMAQSRLDGSAPFPERTGVVVLTMRFVADFHRLVEQWAEWAARETATWEHPDGRDWKGADKVMLDIAQGGQVTSSRPAG